METATWAEHSEVGSGGGLQRLGCPHHPVSVPQAGAGMEQGLQRCAALLAGPRGAGGFGSPAPCCGAEGTQRGRGVRHLHGAGVREGAARGAALWDPPKLQPRVLPGLHPHLAPQPGLPERGHQVSTRGGHSGQRGDGHCALFCTPNSFLGSGGAAPGSWDGDGTWLWWWDPVWVLSPAGGCFPSGDPPARVAFTQGLPGVPGHLQLLHPPQVLGLGCGREGAAHRALQGADGVSAQHAGLCAVPGAVLTTGL